MKTKISLLTSLITGLLFAAALPSAALPGPDDYKKTADDVKKATAPAKLPEAPAPEDVNKALEAAKAAGQPAPKSALPGPDDYKKTADDVKKATASSKAGPLPQAPAPEDVNKAVEAAKGNPAKPSETAGHELHSKPKEEAPARRDPLPTTFSKPGGTTSTSGGQSSNAPYSFYDRYNPNGTQSSSASDKTANNTYDGSPVHYTKPKPTSDTEDWHKKNKNKHHDGDQDQGSFHNNTYDGSPVHYNKPKPTSDTEHWHNNRHHHHDGDQDQGRFSVGFDATKSSSTDRHDRHQENKEKHHHHHGDDQN